MRRNDFLCNLLVPGFAKAGTSSLHRYLDLHPSVCMSSPKEPHFFSRESQWEKGAGFHNALFSSESPDVRFYGESSTTYSIWPPALHRIVDHLNDPKVVILLRDPVERLISHYKWLWALGQERRPIVQAVSESGHGFHPDRSERGNYFAYVEFSSYSKHLPRWSEAFDTGLKLISSDQLLAKPAQTIDDCFRFLGLASPSVIPTIEHNRTISIRRELALSNLVRPVVPVRLRRRLRTSKLVSRSLGFVEKGALSLGHERLPRVNEEDRRWLSEILAEDLEYYRTAVGEADEK